MQNKQHRNTASETISNLVEANRFSQELRGLTEYQIAQLPNPYLQAALYKLKIEGMVYHQNLIATQSQSDKLSQQEQEIKELTRDLQRAYSAAEYSIQQLIIQCLLQNSPLTKDVNNTSNLEESVKFQEISLPELIQSIISVMSGEQINQIINGAKSN